MEWKERAPGLRRLVLEGTHDEIWRLGTGVRTSIEKVVTELERDEMYRWKWMDP
jgi:hypothetical protein